MESWGIGTTASLAARGLRFETVEYAPGHWAERHAHDIAYIDLMLAGAQEARWEGGDVRRTPGGLVFMPVGEAHATVSVRPTHTFQVAIAPSWLESTAQNPLVSGRCADLDVGPLAWHLTRMWKEFQHGDDLTLVVLEGRLLRFMEALGVASRPVETSTPRWLGLARDYVLCHARNGFTVVEIAQEVGVAPAHLMRSYARRYGVTLGDDARRARVAHACRLLGTGPGLGEIALATGFSDQSHLNRVFKRHTGLTPREYRNATRDRDVSFPSKT